MFIFYIANVKNIQVVPFDIIVYNKQVEDFVIC